MCSRRPPPASPRASRKFNTSEIRDSESGGSDISEKLSLLSDDGSSNERRNTSVGSSSAAAARGKTCAKKGTAASPVQSAKPATPIPRRPSTKSPPNPPANPIPEEVAETQQPSGPNNQTEDGSSHAKVSDSSSEPTVDDNLGKMNVQNGLSPEQRSETNGNPPVTTIVSDTSSSVAETTSSSSQDGIAKLSNKSKVKSARCDSTDALIDDKSPVDENNAMD